MKKVFTTIAISLLYIFAQAQQPYPTAPPAPGNITAIEYFIDSNPGYGSGTPLTGLTASPDINGFAATVNLTGLPPGFHRIYFRTRDANGKWSLANNAFFDNYNVPVYATAPPAATNINRIEYSIDAIPAFGAGIALTGFTASTDINGFAPSINITGINPGYHRIFLRSKNANDKWSLTNFSVFDNSASLPYPIAPAPVTNMVQLEYFIDNNDLGFGNCTQITFTAGTDITNLTANINITGLAPGVHRLFIRGKDANGKWSLTNLSVFDNSSSLPYPVAPAPVTNMVQLEYFIDNNDLGFGNCTQIPVTPGTDIANLTANINITGLAPAVHRLHIRGRDANGKWSLTNFSVFDNSAINGYPAAPAPATPIAKMEYYIDSDPGFGNATAIPFTAAVDINNLPVTINTTGLTNGNHKLYIRSKNNSGNWSLTNVDTFAMGTAALPLRLLEFIAERQGTNVLLKWKTADEINTSRFTIQYSTTGQQFSDIGNVNARNIPGTNSYQFTHTGTKEGPNYYRLKMIDIDGNFTYSDTKLIRLDNKRQLQVFPNPVQQFVTVKGLEVNGFLEILSLDGKTLQQWKTNGSSITIDLGKLAAGVYIMQYRNNGEVQLQKIIKQ